MVKLEEWMDIKSMFREGHTIKAIARACGKSRNTVRRVLKEDNPEKRSSRVLDLKLDPYKPFVKERYEACSLSAVRIIEEIQGMGYSGSIQTLRRFLTALRGETSRASKLTVRFETPPGKQAQADWAYCGRFVDAFGREIPVYVFVMVLSFSRMLFVKFTNSMKVEWLVRCQMEAFSYFGGVTDSILYDNMKQVKIGPGQFHPLFLDSAMVQGFEIQTHRVRRPRTKGKVERAVQYVRGGFLNGRSFTDMADLNAQSSSWLNNKANVRIHETTQARPLDLLSEEKLHPFVPYRVVERVSRRAGFDGFVRYGRSKYSVPPEHAGQPVVVEDMDRRITIRSGDMIVADHDRADRPGLEIADPAHVGAMWALTMALADRRKPVPKWEMTFSDRVEARPLSAYEAGL